MVLFEMQQSHVLSDNSNGCAYLKTQYLYNYNTEIPVIHLILSRKAYSVIFAE